MIRLKRWINPPQPLDAQLVELIETVWAAEWMWRLEDRIEAAIRFGRAPNNEPELELRSKPDG